MTRNLQVNTEFHFLDLLRNLSQRNIWHFCAFSKDLAALFQEKNAEKERNLQFKGDIFRDVSFCHTFHDTLLLH